MERPKSMERRRHRILVVDDHPLLRLGMTSLIGEEVDLEVCGQASGYSEAMKFVANERPDVAIVDLSIQDGSGLELIPTLRTAEPELKILVSSMHDESLFAERCLKAGAFGYVSKSEVPEKLIQAIRRVLDGKIYLSEAMTERMLQNAAQASTGNGESPIDTLSNRELEVFDMIGRGLSTKQIAEKINLSIKTVETYRENIKHKLKLGSGNELIRYAVHWAVERA
jgi:DNA-binding NarL/FixJ family response regulator